jgi:uncharacterized protein YbdZ (MbtH family)
MWRWTESRRWRRYLAIGLGLLVVVLVLDYVVGARSEAMSVARVALEQSPEVQRRLGSPVTVKLRPLLGYSNRSGYGNSTAELELVVEGPRGRQPLSVSLKQVKGKWEIPQAMWADGDLLRDLDRNAPAPCFTTVGTEALFTGSMECMRKLPQREIHGFLVTGHEYSAFYRERTDIPAGWDAEATRMSFSPEAWAQVEEKWRPSGEPAIFEITFIGSIAEMKGYYGNGLSTRGAWAERVVDIEEVK